MPHSRAPLYAKLIDFTLFCSGGIGYIIIGFLYYYRISPENGRCITNLSRPAGGKRSGNTTAGACDGFDSFANISLENEIEII